MKRLKNKDFINEALNNAELKPGQKILDYACGPGLFTIPAAKLVGGTGVVYAADIVPVAERYVLKQVHSENLKNVRFIVTRYSLNISDEFFDRILLFDCIHMLKNRELVLKELYRVLHPSGLLCVEVDHISEEKSRNLIEEFNLFLWNKTQKVGSHGSFILVYQKNIKK
jgi:ubiquinone/menaquinone biosynthesis C-methylase UbiE